MYVGVKDVSVRKVKEVVERRKKQQTVADGIVECVNESVQVEPRPLRQQAKLYDTSVPLVCIVLYVTTLSSIIVRCCLVQDGGLSWAGTRARSGAISGRCQHRTGTEKRQGHLVRELEGIALTYFGPSI